jgi:replicative DNA helicase
VDYTVTAGGNGKVETESRKYLQFRNLKALALNVPVIALSQLSRAVETVDLVKTFTF